MRWAVLAAVFLLGCAEPDRAPALDVAKTIEALHSDDPTVRAAAATALGELRGVQARPAVGALARALADPNRAVREEAAKSLGKVGPPAANAIHALILALRDPDDYVRYRSAESLAHLGPLAHQAVPELEIMARDDQTEIGGYWAKEALRRIRGEESKSP